MKINSLGFRLFISSTVLAILILSVGALLLISQYRNTIESNFDERLKASLSLLIERSLDDKYEKLQKPTELGGFAFTLLNSGWYWQIESIKDKQSTPLYFSKSVGSIALVIAKQLDVTNEADGSVKYYIEGKSGRRLRVIERNLVLGGDEGENAYRYIVTGDSTEIDDVVIDFASMLAITFLTLGLGMIAATILQVRFGLKPLQVIQNGLTAVRAGKTDRLEGIYPAEIEPLQKEINNLIDSNINIIERARTHVGNLAHALKTPLSVIKNESHNIEEPYAQKILDQTSVMQDQITHHLDRARMAARVGVVSSITDVKPVLLSLERALLRIYQEKAITFTLNCPEDAKFAGEKQDLEEMIGNLLDNAFKWANNKVICSISIESPKLGVKLLIIRIEDDGPGLNETEKVEVLKRGNRLDESKPGSGLGLSIVTDLAELYNGHISLDESSVGGLGVNLQLPAVK